MSEALRSNGKCKGFRVLCLCVAGIFIFTAIIFSGYAQANSLPGEMMITATDPFKPAMIKGLRIDPDNPLMFDFIVDTGDTGINGEALKLEGEKLIKYFLASLTVPEEDLWVNLSPNEPDRIIPEGFGDTEMGRDILAQDYLLKQLTAAMMYPEESLGEKFWDRVYERAYEKFGTTDISVNTFNKIWIVPSEATVYEHEEDASVYVVNQHLKVMLEQDYLARGQIPEVSEPWSLTSEIICEILIPEIEREVNEGWHFANLRQIFNSLILAAWYKQNLKQSLLGQVYVDQNKTKGVDTQDKAVVQEIYTQYLTAFRRGAYNIIKEDYDAATQKIIPRKYFSGGVLAKIQIRTIKNTDSGALDSTMAVAYARDAQSTFRLTAGLVEADISDDAQLAIVAEMKKGFLGKHKQIRPF